MKFEFATATRILFGPGGLRDCGPVLRSLGTQALLVTGRGVERSRPVQQILADQAIGSTPFVSIGEPTIEHIRSGLQTAKEAGCDLVIGFGGGSAIDAGKAIAGLLTNDGDLMEYLEVVGLGRPLENPGAPFVAVPTTAGAGAEVTKNAVIVSAAHQVKASLRSPFLLARLAIVDPQLTHSLPPDVTASTGLDALTQLIEPFVSCRANPLTDALCRDGMRRAARSLRRVYQNGQDTQAREDMALASLLGGLALANAGLGAVHGFAAPIGGGFAAPHGAVCAALLPAVAETNIRALQQRQPAHPALPRYAEMAALLTAKPDATIEMGVGWLRELCATLSIPPLRTYGLMEKDMPSLCEKAAAASSMKGNPLPLTLEELHGILQQAR